MSGNEILFTVEEEPLKPDSANGGAATRAAKVTSISSFKLYAYSGTTAIADGVTYTKSGNSWNPNSKVFWPQSGNVTFYAFSPASNSAVSFDTSNKQIKYTAPTSQGSQQDVLYAYASSSRPSTNTVNLTFNHANAAFSVSAQLATGCTATVNVAGVRLVNVMPTNTLTVSSGSASASGSNISTDVAINSTTLTTTATTISSAPLMLPPQSVTAWSGTSALANTYLAVSCKVQANDNYVVGSASANGTVYVPMDKTLTKGQDNTVNLIFGSDTGNGRSYGRDANGNRITISDIKNKDDITSADLGKVITYEAHVFNTVAEATAAGEHAAGMIAYVSETGKGTAIALDDYGDASDIDYSDLSDDYNNVTYSGYSSSALIPKWGTTNSEEYIEFFKAFGGSGEYSSNETKDDYRADGSFDATNFRAKLKACGGDDFDESIMYATGTEGSYGKYLGGQGSEDPNEYPQSENHIFYDYIDFHDEYISCFEAYIRITEDTTGQIVSQTDVSDLRDYSLRLCFGF